MLSTRANVEIYTGRDLDRLLLDRPGRGRPKIYTSERVHNLIPLTGLNILRDLLARGAPGTGGGYAPTHYALGSGTTQPAHLDRFLEAENYRDEITVRAGTDASGFSAVRYQLFLSLTQGVGLTFSEAGLFDNPEGPDRGEMLGRVVFTPIAKTGLIELVLTWTIFLQNA